jgi:2-haloacid dehalogenase
MNDKRFDAGVDSISRRSILGFTAAAAALPISMRIGAARAAPAAPPNPSGVKAMTFDIQGTLFDYYQPFARVSAALSKRKGLNLNWSGLLLSWNAEAISIIQAITAGKQPWIPPGKIFRQSLDTVLAVRGQASQLDDADRADLMSIWSQMAPWQDSVEGVARLKRNLTVAALSNAGMAGVIGLAKRSGVSFDAVLTGELVHSYKPAANVYQAASAYLGFSPSEIMMVATHKFDLKAAKEAGLRTAYIPRPLELGPETKVDRSPEAYIDVVADDLIDLSRKIAAA